jgi:hypothetical protein
MVRTWPGEYLAPLSALFCTPLSSYLLAFECYILCLRFSLLHSFFEQVSEQSSGSHDVWNLRLEFFSLALITRSSTPAATKRPMATEHCDDLKVSDFCNGIYPFEHQ